MSENSLQGEGIKAFANDLVETLPSQIVVLDETGLIVAVNAAYRKFAAENGADQKTAEGIGQNYISAIRLRDADHLEGAAEAQDGLLGVMSRQRSDFRLIYPCDTLTESCWFLMYVAPIQDKPGYVGVSHTDVTDYKQAELELRSANRELEQQALARAKELEHFFTVSLDMYCVVKQEGYFVRVNPAFTRTLGWTEEELLAVPFFEFVHPDDRLATRDETDEVMNATMARTFENRYRHKNGTWRTISWNSVIGIGGLIYATARDVTEQQEMVTNLQSAKDAAEKANLAKSEFLSRMSHELRTPMNAVLGYAQLLDLKHDDPIIKKASHAILKGGRHLLALINEVLDLSRIESGNLGISLESVSLNESISEAIHLLRQVAEDASVSVKLVGDCETLFVKADRQRFLQVLLNVIGNAIKYNHFGGSVEIRCTQPSEDLHRIEVSDTGHGIPQESQELLFQPFQRFGDPGIDGSGLGLALSERFVKLMGGTLGLTESSPTGSTFFIELKKEEPPEKLLQGADVVKSTGVLANLAGTVLYIEDNLSNIDLIQTVLSDWKNVNIVSVSKGQLGLEFAAHNHVDLILLDVHLPDLMGDQVLERLKSITSTKDVAVVMLSADATRKRMSASLDAGAAEYLTKPIDLARLYEVLLKYLPVE